MKAFKTLILTAAIFFPSVNRTNGDTAASIVWLMLKPYSTTAIISILTATMMVKVLSGAGLTTRISL